MTTPTFEEMQRQVIAYAAEEWRNRGLEEAARIADQWDLRLARDIRSLKRDPSAKLTEWFATSPAAQVTVSPPAEDEPSREPDLGSGG